VIRTSCRKLKLESQERPELSLSSNNHDDPDLETDGSVTFPALRWHPASRKWPKAALAPVEFSGDKGFSLLQRFRSLARKESTGLDQHQDGYMNYRGRSVTLVQGQHAGQYAILFPPRGTDLVGQTSKTIFKDGPDG